MVPTEVTAEFHEDWFCAASQTVLGNLVGFAPTEGLIVEVGSWEGRSTIALANAAHPRGVYAVDHWRGSPGEPSAELAAVRDVFAQWQANVARFTQGNVEPYRMGWREFLPTLDGEVALVFIDAEHTYDEVHDCITGFLPVMKPGGVICGDDAHHPPVRDAVLDLMPGAQVSATVWWWKL